MRRALGKGLTQLLDHEGESPSGEVAVADIVANPRQPRKRFVEQQLNELAESIRQHGVVQPLLVRQGAGSKYELIAGERRLRAAKLAGLRTVPVVVRQADAQTSLELALIENVQREDINPLECALAYRQLADEFSMTQDQIAAKVGKSRAAVTNAMRLLKLPDEVKQSLNDGSISEGHAKALLMIESPVRLLQVFHKILLDDLSVREAERLARSEGRFPAEQKPEAEPDPDWVALTKRVSDHFGARVKIDRKSSGGRLTIDYYSDDELEGILEKMGVRL